MKYIDEFRNPKLAHRLVEEIARRVTRDWTMMEICGGQTHTLVRYGFEEMLPRQVHLVHGPGCPVCVTPLEVVDKGIEVAGRPECDFCVVWRHVARARIEERSLSRKGRRR